MADYERILYSAEGGVARLTLNRPEKRNALDALVIAELKQALRSAAGDADIRVIVLAGAGSDFCSGADLAEVRRSMEAGVMENLGAARDLAELFLDMRRLRCPIIAAVRGRALAGGCGLATAADIILAADTSQFGYPEVNIGFVPAMVMAILRRCMPEKRAFELITSGQTLTAQTAHEMGLVNHVYAEAEFDAAVTRYALHLAGMPASAVSLSKSLLYQMDGMPFEAALESGVQVNAIARMTGDCRRGIERFLAKDR